MAFFSGYGFDSYLGNGFGSSFGNGFDGWFNNNNDFSSAFSFGNPDLSSFSAQNFGGQSAAGFGLADWGNNLDLNSFNTFGLGSSSSLGAFDLSSSSLGFFNNNGLDNQFASLDTSSLNATFSTQLKNFQPQLQQQQQLHTGLTLPPQQFQSTPLAFPQPEIAPAKSSSRLDFSQVPDFSKAPTLPTQSKAFAAAAAAPAVPQLAFQAVPSFAPCQAAPLFAWPPAAALPAKTTSSVREKVKPAKSGKEAKPTKTIREKRTESTASETLRKIKEVPPAKTIKELSATTLVNDKTKNLKLIEGIMLASKNQGRRLSAENSLDLADVLDFYEWLREKKRRINIAKLLE